MFSEKDKHVLEALIKRDEKTLWRFYKDYKKPLLHFILKHLNDINDAEEVLQDSFLAFVEGLRDFRRQSSLKTFLFAIAKNKIVDKLRKKKLKQILFSYIPQPIIESVASVFLDDDIDKKILTQKIDAVLGKLPNDYALVLRLKYKEGYKVAEIAERIKLSLKATESLIFRARKAFVVAYRIHERYDFPQSKKTTR